MKFRTVTLELLRAGPPHNQLLSPLTQYLGVCGEAGAGVVTLPYEHYTFERRLAQLRYEDGTDEDTAKRLELLRSTGEDMARILSAVPGLPGAVTSDRRSSILTHLRLVLSAAELSLLPFELCKVPAGSDLPRENWLLLQTHAPVCLTRHIRSVPCEGVRWPTRPRILFITGDPSDLPFAEHLAALHRAVAPWVGPAGLEEWLTVIDNATLAQIQEACAATDFTHVHILAHGAEDETAAGTSFGLSLLDHEGIPDVVSGERLASALASLASGHRHRPTVVTAATCDSANVGEVKTPGASFAHALHQAGIPLVLASQFPLSMEGSVALVERLYSGLLWGENPLLLLHGIRSELHSRFTNHSHDWASLVVYEALPPDLATQLEELVYWQTRRALGAALGAIEQKVASGSSSLDEAEFAGLIWRITTAQDRLPKEGPYAMECLGLRAASHKRLAAVEYRLAAASSASEETRARHAKRCYELLEDAFEDYREAVGGFLLSTDEAVHRQASLHWVLVQAVSLGEILGRSLGQEHWMVAKLSAETYLQHANREEVAWAHGSLAELWLLQVAASHLPAAGRAEAADKARHHAAQILELFPRPGAFPVDSTRRQFERYTTWWGSRRFSRGLVGAGRRKGWGGSRGVLATAESLVAILDRKPLPKTKTK